MVDVYPVELPMDIRLAADHRAERIQSVAVRGKVRDRKKSGEDPLKLNKRGAGGEAAGRFILGGDQYPVQATTGDRGWDINPHAILIDCKTTACVGNPLIVPGKVPHDCDFLLLVYEYPPNSEGHCLHYGLVGAISLQKYLEDNRWLYPPRGHPGNGIELDELIPFKDFLETIKIIEEMTV